MDNGGQAKVKMSGYLYKKCKKRMISSWKMYWFVLEDRLLLFYRSKDEYQAISPCKGSINLGPPCIVKSFPSVANAFQIETRTNTFTLRAERSDDQIGWMQAILSVLNQKQNGEGPKRLNHFRYSLDNLVPEVEANDKHPLERQNTMPERIKETRNSKEIIQRLQKMGAHSYGGSLGAITKIASKKAASPTLAKHVPSQSSLSGSGEEKPHDGVELRDKGCDNIYERISGDSNRPSFLVDNENYSVPVRKAREDVESVLVENCHYATIPVDRDVKSILFENPEYVAEEVLVENDHYMTTSSAKTASLLVENDHYAKSPNFCNDDVIYAEPKISEIDHNKNSVLMDDYFYAVSDVKNDNNENLYEDVEKYNHYSQPVVKNEETSSHSSQESKMASKTASKKNRTKSFIKRVWRKKEKKTKKEDSVEEIYEEVNPMSVEKLEYNSDKKVQILSELHDILELKKSKLKMTVSNSSHEEQTEDIKNKPSTSNSDVCPSLPPKTQKAHTQRHDVPKNNQPMEPEPLRSLDEILEDLDREKLASKNKVKMLIERFSEPESDDVILRKHNKPDFKVSRDSDELNKLLNELAKVTSAPILTPGVTSSLVNPNLSDAEWMKLLPPRRRRMSEPDYDVPRPHKSITVPVKDETPDAIPATRFFGPVLPPAVTDNSPKEDSLSASMTPDSLEVEDQHKSPTHSSYTSHNYCQYKNDNEPDRDLKCFSHNYKPKDDQIIYAMPKSYLSVATHIVNTCQNICSAQLAEECTIIYKNVKNVDVQEEIFKDSLELCHE